MNIPNNHYANAARALTAQFEIKNEIIVDVSSKEKDSHIFRVMLYLNHYFGKYSIEYLNNNTAIIRKQR